MHKAAGNGGVPEKQEKRKILSDLAVKECIVGEPVADQRRAHDGPIAGTRTQYSAVAVAGSGPSPIIKFTAAKKDVPNIYVAVSAPGKKKVHIWGLLAFAVSIGAWFVMEVLALPLFVIAAVLAFYSINRISRDPEKYTLKTLSLLALILSLVGVALSLFMLVLLLFS